MPSTIETASEDAAVSITGITVHSCVVDQGSRESSLCLRKRGQNPELAATSIELSAVLYRFLNKVGLPRSQAQLQIHPTAYPQIQAIRPNSPALRCEPCLSNPSAVGSSQAGWQKARASIDRLGQDSVEKFSCTESPRPPIDRKVLPEVAGLGSEVLPQACQHPIEFESI